MHRLALTSLGLLMMAAPATLRAQIDITAEWGLVGYMGHATSTIEEDTDLRPAGSQQIGIALGVQRGNWRYQAGFRANDADLTIFGPGAAAVTTDALRSLTVSAAAGRRLIGGNRQPSLTWLVFMAYSHWQFKALEGEDRNRWGFGSALEGTLALAKKWDGMLRTDFTISGGLFDQDELPIGYETRNGRRVSLSMGLRFIP